MLLHPLLKRCYNILNGLNLSGFVFQPLLKKGKSLTHGNIDPEWENFQVDKFFEERTGQKFFILNDADAAGLAEMEFGVGKGREGLVMMITIGTGLGSGVLLDGRLIPNFELGRMLGKDDQPIEYYAANSARKKI